MEHKHVKQKCVTEGGDKKKKEQRRRWEKGKGWTLNPQWQHDWNHVVGNDY